MIIYRLGNKFNLDNHHRYPYNEVYIKGILTKYSAGSEIANVPSSASLAGQFLKGRYILKMPMQQAPIPTEILKKADELKIIIQDINKHED